MYGHDLALDSDLRLTGINPEPPQGLEWSGLDRDQSLNSQSCPSPFKNRVSLHGVQHLLDMILGPLPLGSFLGRLSSHCCGGADSEVAN